MDEIFDDNIIVDNALLAFDEEFKYNFINTPWDDRSRKSKLGILALIISIFVATMTCVIGGFINHYKEHGRTSKLVGNSNEVQCLRVKMSKYNYVARIHSVATQQLLCIGAVVSRTSILANGICVKSGPVRIHLGTLLRCKNGFQVDVIESLHHDGVVSKKLVLLSSYDHIDECGHAITIGHSLDWKAKVHVLGRPDALRQRFSLQRVTLVNRELGSLGSSGRAGSNVMGPNTICVKDLARCPVRVGDLLVQNGQLYGFATSSILRTDQYIQACFADLNDILHELKELDSDIMSDSS